MKDPWNGARLDSTADGEREVVVREVAGSSSRGIFTIIEFWPAWKCQIGEFMMAVGYVLEVAVTVNHMRATLHFLHTLVYCLLWLLPKMSYQMTHTHMSIHFQNRTGILTHTHAHNTLGGCKQFHRKFLTNHLLPTYFKISSPGPYSQHHFPNPSCSSPPPHHHHHHVPPEEEHMRGFFYHFFNTTTTHSNWLHMATPG